MARPTDLGVKRSLLMDDECCLIKSEFHAASLWMLLTWLKRAAKRRTAYRSSSCRSS